MYDARTPRVGWPWSAVSPMRQAPDDPGRPDRRYLSRGEVARLLDVSPHTVYRWTREGRLPYVLTPGGRRRYPREEVERLAETWLRVHPTRYPPVGRAG